MNGSKASIKKAKVLACLEEIPTFVINMRPAGLRLMHDQNDLTYFDKQPVHQNWEEYDNYLKKLVAVSKSKKSTGGFLYVPIPNLNLEFSISATEGR